MACREQWQLQPRGDHSWRHHVHHREVDRPSDGAEERSVTTYPIAESHVARDVGQDEICAPRRALQLPSEESQQPGRRRDEYFKYTIATMGRKAGIYTRISLDRDGTSESPEVQEATCRRHIEQEGWELVRVYSDRDRSAFKKGAKRPEFERLLRDATAGEIDCVVVFKLDRLTRGGVSVIGRVIDLLETHNGALVAVRDGLDTSKGGGRLTAAVLSEIAKQESENTRIRVMAAQQKAATVGRMHGGGSRHFGYVRLENGPYIGVDPDEAVIVREVAQRVLAGESLRKIAFDLNDRGVKPPGRGKTTQGKEWYSVTVGQMIRSPRLAAIRIYRDGQPDREVHDGKWDPILSKEEHLAVLAALQRPLAVRRAVRRHLLTGIVTCGACGGSMKPMGFVMKNGKSFPRYQCVKSPGYKNCGRVAAAENSLDKYVVDCALTFLSHAMLRPLEDDQVAVQDLEREIVEDVQALRDLTHERFVARHVGQDEYELARAELQERLDANRQTIEALRRRIDETRMSLKLGDREGLDRWWETATIEERRELLAPDVLEGGSKPSQAPRRQQVQHRPHQPRLSVGLVLARGSGGAAF